MRWLCEETRREGFVSTIVEADSWYEARTFASATTVDPMRVSLRVTPAPVERKRRKETA